MYFRIHSNLLSFLLRCGTRPHEWVHPRRIELTREGLQIKLANHYTTNWHPYVRICIWNIECRMYVMYIR